MQRVLKGWAFDIEVPAAVGKARGFWTRRSDAEHAAGLFNYKKPAPKAVRASLVIYRDKPRREK